METRYRIPGSLGYSEAQLPNYKFKIDFAGRHVQCDKDDLPILGTPEPCSKRSAEKHLMMSWIVTFLHKKGVAGCEYFSGNMANVSDSGPIHDSLPQRTHPDLPFEKLAGHQS